MAIMYRLFRASEFVHPGVPGFLAGFRTADGPGVERRDGWWSLMAGAAGASILRRLLRRLGSHVTGAAGAFRPVLSVSECYPARRMTLAKLHFQ